MFTISIPDLNDSLVEVELDEEVFFLHFSWNSTAQYWTLSIENAYNDELVSGVPLLVGRRLLENVRRTELPLGDFVVLRHDSLQSAGRDDFTNGKAEFIYISIDDD